MNKLFQFIKNLINQEYHNPEAVNTPSENLGNRSDPVASGSSSGYVAFDLEIAKVFPGDFSNWRSQRPLGISCAALQFDGYKPELWFSRTENGEYAEKMSREDVSKLVDRLRASVDKGWKILTWNGLGFDFDVLAEESDRWEDCRKLALNHIDMMFHFFCLQGYPLALDKAAKGAGLSGKPKGMTGDLAPVLWQQGKHAQVMEYVAQDVRTTLALAKDVARSKRIAWTSNKGRFQQVFFPNGWLNVNQAKELSYPDNAWMTNPMSRNDFLSWTIKLNNSRSAVKNEDILPLRKFPPKERFQKTISMLNHQDTISEREINAIFSLYDHSLDYPAFIEPDLEQLEIEEEFEDDLWEKECHCPICMGTPEFDHIFLYKYSEWDYDPYDDGY